MTQQGGQMMPAGNLTPLKVLFLTSSEEDYLADGLLLGLRSLADVQVVDYPRHEILCPDSLPASRGRVRGGGFTLYTTRPPDGPVDRFHIRPRLAAGEFDLVIVSDIWRQAGLFQQWRPYLNGRNTIIVDGADTPQVYPFAGQWWRKPYNWFVPRAHGDFLYFKREWTPASQFNLWHRLIPRRLWARLPSCRNLRKVSFSIPGEKVLTSPPAKVKNFPCHIVDAEVAARVPGSGTSYAFTTEEEYYRDLQMSRFGITTKRAGWDCLRHYEIAANGAVPCFRNLQQKPETCAPHGLIPGENCLSYKSAEDLFGQIGRITELEYGRIQAAALAWARLNSCSQRASELLSHFPLSMSHPIRNA
jgi:hypothetical protein